MTREARLAQAFIDLADTLVQNFDVLDLLRRLCERCVEILDAEAAGLLLVDEHRALRVVAVSDENHGVMEVFEAQHTQGPCYDAYARVEQVLAADLGDVQPRWPDFIPLALARDWHAASAFPLRLRGQCLGALGLLERPTAALVEADAGAAQALADAATIAILQERRAREARELNEQLRGALGSRVVIEQAKGIVSARLHVGLEVAFQQLRRYSQDQNIPVRDVARRVVAGTVAPHSLSGPRQP